uniref:Secreted protein n=1 Tax=Strombidium rassoulzadegani TaxID=1082188 RepID=A0A7S3CKB7_9SPIT|mmetsp:Transcript_13863/g.23635  ORF Transcript_13863/g.23635 Transcript_13863/m.23635 type:complete len:203 (+) Transcript_13863:56-664(+)
MAALSVLLLVGSAVVVGLLSEDLLAVSGLATLGRLPGGVHPGLAFQHVLLAVLVEKVALVLVGELRVVGLENLGPVLAEVGVDEVLVLGGVVVHVVHPALPAGRDLLGNRGEELSSVGELHPPPLVLVLVREVLVVAVAELVHADQGRDLVGEAGLLVRGFVDFAPEDSAHEPLLAVELPELRVEHTRVDAPRSHCYLSPRR